MVNFYVVSFQKKNSNELPENRRMSLSTKGHPVQRNFYPVLTSILRGVAFSTFGSESLSTPSFSLASILL
jgi:hypothetical protein